jgi:radical SAM superfamily enzyme YgiQ (UPF0313 family)
MLKKLLIISFDLIREGECQKSYSISSLLSYLKQDPRYNRDFQVDHISYNLFDESINISNERPEKLGNIDLNSFSAIAISNYVWSESKINQFIVLLRKLGFRNKIILGGNQINISDINENHYPDCKTFILGYGEKSLLDAFYSTESDLTQNVFITKLNIEEIPSVYLTHEIDVTQNQSMVRMETKRGCPYSCNFCAHRDIKESKVYEFPINRVFSELYLFRQKNVNKINFIDPVFNYGSNYNDILHECLKIGLTSILSLQTKFELISGERGGIFLDLCSELNVDLEFGLQTINPEECKVIKRYNNLDKVKEILYQLNHRKINYEVSLIYGLPNQTLSSFMDAIHFLVDNGFERIRAYPLMLLKGTELYFKKNQLGLKERNLSTFDIPIVISSNTFTEDDWMKMNIVAENLNKNPKNEKRKTSSIVSSLSITDYSIINEIKY